MKYIEHSISLLTFHTGQSIHHDHTLYSVGAAEAVSWANGHNLGRVTTPTQDTQMAQSSQ